MYKIVWNENRNSFTVFQMSFSSGKEKEIFYTKDTESLASFMSQIGITRDEINYALDTMDREHHNVMEFGVQKKLVLTYNLDH